MGAVSEWRWWWCGGKAVGAAASSSISWAASLFGGRRGEATKRQGNTPALSTHDKHVEEIEEVCA